MKKHPAKSMYAVFTLTVLTLIISCNRAPGSSKIEVIDNPTPQKAMELLKEGNKRFLSGNLLHPNSSPERLAQVAKGQKPFATILACSDSRVPVEYIFDRGFGDLFIVKVAGNVADTDEIGTIEYGTAHLHTPLLLVLGHSKCGAVTAVAKNETVHGSIPELVDNIIVPVKKTREQKGENVDEWLNQAIEENAMHSIEEVFQKSHEVRELVKGGKLEVLAGIYNIETGEVRFIGQHPKQSELIAAADASHKEEHK
jgi:carbonic anhydrase